MFRTHRLDANIAGRYSCGSRTAFVGIKKLKDSVCRHKEAQGQRVFVCDLLFANFSAQSRHFFSVFKDKSCDFHVGVGVFAVPVCADFFCVIGVEYGAAHHNAAIGTP